MAPRFLTEYHLHFVALLDQCKKDISCFGIHFQTNHYCLLLNVLFYGESSFAVHQRFINGKFLLWQIYVPEWILQPFQVAAWLSSNGHCFLHHHYWQNECVGAATEISIETWLHKMLDSGNKFFVLQFLFVNYPHCQSSGKSLLPKYPSKVLFLPLNLH